MSIFLHRVIDSMLEAEESLENQVLILPSRRAITFFRSALAKRLDKPTFLPLILTMEDLAREISQLQSLDQVSTALELYDSYREIYADAEPYETFEAWTGAILRDFNTIDTYLLNTTEVYRDLRLIKEINEWSFASEELLGGQVEFNRFWQRLSNLYERFNQRLHDHGHSYSGGILRKAAENVGKRRVFPKHERVTFAGFNAISPAEIAILDQFHAESRLFVLWDDAPFYRENPADPAGLFLRRWKKKKWDQSFGQPRKEEVQLNITAHPHAISQVTWAGSLLAKSNLKSERIAIVLADEKLLTPLMDRFPKALEHVNITIGISFTETSVFKFITAFFRIHIRAQQVVKTGAEWAVHHQELRRWVEMASHFKLLDRGAIGRLESKIVNDRSIYFNQEELEAIFPSGVAEQFGLRPLSREDILSLAVRQLEGVESKDKLIKGVAIRLGELLEEARAVVDRYEFIESIEALWKCVRGGLSRERISFVGEPLQGVQVMGLLETRALDFDEVILLGANEGSLPKAQRFDSFLPFDLRRHYSLPTQREEDAVFAYYFYRLFHGAQHVHIAFTSERDELGGGEQSRYLSQIIAGLPQKEGLRISVTETNFTPKSNTVPRPWVEIKKSDEVVESVLRWFTGRGVSFSRISEYSRCPLDFYYRTVLGLGEQREVEEELGSADLGDIVHKVLEESYRPLLGKGALTAEDIARIEANANGHLDDVISEKGLEDMVATGESALVLSVSKHMLQNFFKREALRISRNKVHVQRLEEHWELLSEVSIGGMKHPIKFIAKIDRIEQQDGVEVLIDFKTGKVKSGDVMIKELSAKKLFDSKNSKSLQLLYYLWFYWRHTSGKLAKAGIISMIGMEEEPLLLHLEGESIASADQLLRFEELLFEQLDMIATDGVFAHDTERGFYCNYCLDKAKNNW